MVAPDVDSGRPDPNATVSSLAGDVHVEIRADHVTVDATGGAVLVDVVVGVMTMALVSSFLIAWRASRDLPLGKAIRKWLRSRHAKAVSLKRKSSTLLKEMTSVEPIASLSPRRPSSSFKSSIISGGDVDDLVAWLPMQYHGRPWQMTFSTARDGHSLRTFYANTSALPMQAAVVLLVKDALGAVFGVFCTEPWVRSRTHIGNGESFVFTLHPVRALYSWTRRNSFFVVGQTDFIAAGGGSHFAIWIDASFDRGSSLPSETFGNPTLSSAPDFVCNLVELWSVSPF